MAKANTAEINVFKGKLQELGSEISDCSSKINTVLTQELPEGLQNRDIEEGFLKLSENINKLNNEWSSLQTETVNALESIRTEMENQMQAASNILNK